MKQSLKIWVIVAAMVIGGALPPQVTGDNGITSQWCAQAKNKKKDKKDKKKSKKDKKKSKKSRASRKSKASSATVSPLANVPTIGKTATVVPRQDANALLGVTVDKGVSNQVLNYQTIRVNYNPSLRIPNCVAYELTATMVDMADAPDHENRKNYNSLLAVTIPKGVSNQVLNYQAIRVNFNPSLRIPNCVAYELTATMVAMADAPDHEVRKNYNYAKDASVKGCPENWEYRGSGYSRGHMAPAMDMRWDKTAMAQCFYMTNMCPQDTKLNNAPWRVLEERVHRWAKRDKRIMVYTGPIMGKNPKMIGKDKQNIAVPEAFFKVLYAPEQGRAIAFIYPNSPSPGGIKKYAVTVAEVERRTGLTFSSAIPKRQCKIEDWE